MTSSQYRAQKAEARARDREWERAYMVGRSDERREHRRLVVVGAALAVILLLRRHTHPMLALLWAGLWALALAPLVALGTAVELTVRQHRRWGSWPRTGALAATWAAGAGLVVLAAAWRAPWPLLGVPVALAGWAGERVWRARSERRGLRYSQKGEVSPQVVPSWAAFPASARCRSSSACTSEATS